MFNPNEHMLQMNTSTLDPLQKRFVHLLEDLSFEMDHDRLATALRSNDLEVFELKSKQQHAGIAAVFRSRLGSSDLAMLQQVRGGEPLVVLTEHVGGALGDLLRRADLQYLDADGNAFLFGPGLRVDVRGRRRTFPVAPPTSRSTEHNLFSRRRAQVLFVLLSWPDLLGAPIRAVAGSAGVSVGLAQQTMQLLFDRALLVDERSPFWANRNALLEQWLVAYPDALRRYTLQASFAGDPRETRFPDGIGPVAVSGEAAVPEHIHPASLTVYTEAHARQLVLLNRWRTDQTPNIFVRDLFWTAPGGNPPGASTAPPLLVYADLLASGDPRQRVAAAAYREDHVRLQAV